MILLVGQANAIKLYIPTFNMKTDKIYDLILDISGLGRLSKKYYMVGGGGTRSDIRY